MAARRRFMRSLDTQKVSLARGPNAQKILKSCFGVADFIN
jgi:hypothetical protein